MAPFSRLATCVFPHLNFGLSLQDCVSAANAPLYVSLSETAHLVCGLYDGRCRSFCFKKAPHHARRLAWRQVFVAGLKSVGLKSRGPAVPLLRSGIFSVAMPLLCSAKLSAPHTHTHTLR